MNEIDVHIGFIEADMERARQKNIQRILGSAVQDNDTITVEAMIKMGLIKNNDNIVDITP